MTEHRVVDNGTTVTAVDRPPTFRPSTSRSGVLGRIDLWQQRHTVAAFPVGVAKKFSDDRGGRLAALVAYYGFFSIFPALLALVTVLGFVLQNRPAERERIANSALAQFPIIGDSIASSVSHPLTGSGLALVIGVVAALWAGLGAMQACQDAMNEVWDVARADYPSFVAKRLRSLAMLVFVALLLAASTLVAQLTGLAGSGWWVRVLFLVVTVGFNVVAFQLGFRVLTVAHVSFRTVLPGACVASIGYTLLQLLGSVYVSRTLRGAAKTYGTFAVVIGLLSWILAIAQVVMISAEVNVVASKQLWPRSLFTEPVTPSDRRSAKAEVAKEAITDGMTVEVAFDSRHPDAPPSAQSTSPHETF